MHALAVAGHTVWDPEEWPGLATALLTRGAGRPTVGGSVSDAVTLLGHRWMDLRTDLPRTPEERYPAGVVARNCAWWLAELAAFQDTGPDMIVLLSETRAPGAAVLHHRVLLRGGRSDPAVVARRGKC